MICDLLFQPYCVKRLRHVETMPIFKASLKYLKIFYINYKLIGGDVLMLFGREVCLYVIFPSFHTLINFHYNSHHFHTNFIQINKHKIQQRI